MVSGIKMLAADPLSPPCIGLVYPQMLEWIEIIIVPT